jgi:hypothetical protein
LDHQTVSLDASIDDYQFPVYQHYREGLIVNSHKPFSMMHDMVLEKLHAHGADWAPAWRDVSSDRPWRISPLEGFIVKWQHKHQLTDKNCQQDGFLYPRPPSYNSFTHGMILFVIPFTLAWVVVWLKLWRTGRLKEKSWWAQFTNAGPGKIGYRGPREIRERHYDE